MRRVVTAMIVAVALLSAPIAHGQAGEWTWVDGSNVSTPQASVYGTRRFPTPGNLPGNRAAAATATDNIGNFWLFGGVTGLPGTSLNDLWEYVPASNLWTWFGGNDATPALYGTYRVAAPGNTPGPRQNAVLWADNGGGKIWLFGGLGYDSAGTFGLLDDLWRFDPGIGEWAWMGGSSTLPKVIDPCIPGSYGRDFSPKNVPGGRQGALGWTGIDGNLRLFGGYGCDSTVTEGLLDDLWEVDEATGQWKWISGSSTGASFSTSGIAGVYGRQGTSAAANTPGGRWSMTNFGADKSGNLWLLGGDGYDSAGSRGYMNDLWEFNPVTNQWTWQSGSATVPPSSSQYGTSQPGVYGTLGQFAKGNVPGGRYYGAGSIGGDGRLWLFGGGNSYAGGAFNYFNDLWAFDPTLNQWAWMSGSDTLTCFTLYPNGTCAGYGSAASYGSKGVPAASNVPGSREGAAGWTDTDGNVWLFGGSGVDSAGAIGPLNDLWKFQTAAAAVPTTPVFGTMSFSPTAMVVVGTSETITISDTLTFTGVQPTGSVTYVLNGKSYTAACTPASGSQLGSPETCSAQVPAAAIAELSVGPYTVTGSIEADNNYNSASTIPDKNGNFTVTATAAGCTVPAPPPSNTMNIAYFTLANSDKDGGTFPNGVSSNYVLSGLGTNGLPIYNTKATADSGFISAPKDLLAGNEITWWSPALNNGGPGGGSDVVATGTGVISLPFSNNGFYPPNGAGPNDANGFQTALLTGNLVTPAPETVSFNIASDDMAFLYLDGQIACDDGGVHAPVSVPCTTSTIAAGAHTLQLFYADLNQRGAALDFMVTTSNVGVGAGNQLVFGTMTFSPAATEPVLTSQAITISDAIIFSGAQPTGAVSFTLHEVTYPATCTTAGSPANQETCSAVVPADAIAALPVGVYTVAGDFKGDCNYAAASAPAGRFTITPEVATFGTMTFSPTANVLVGTSQAITISDTLSYPGPTPTGAVVYVLNGVNYTATCSSGGSPETCTAQVGAATVAALPPAIYTVTGSLAGDNVYAAAMAPSGTFTVTLPPPDFSIAATSLTLVTQHHGQTTISVTPINNFAGTVALSCGAVPAYVTCEWGPAEVMVSGGTASTKLLIDTSGILNYLAAARPPDSPRGWAGGRSLLAGLAFPALLLLGRRRRNAVRLMLCAVVLVSMLKLSGCSGRYPDSTVPGSYSITVTGSGGALQHSTVLTLVVTP